MNDTTDRQIKAKARELFVGWLERNMPGMNDLDCEAAWQLMPDDKRASWLNGAREQLEAQA